MNIEDFEVGYNIPARVGMREEDVHTPCLLVDLDAFERNIAKMGELAKAMGVRLRVHGKMHKSADIALYQMSHGNACGLCCQKVSEAEAFARHGVNGHPSDESNPRPREDRPLSPIAPTRPHHRMHRRLE